MPKTTRGATRWFCLALAGLLCLGLAPAVSLAQTGPASDLAPGAAATIADPGGEPVLLRTDPSYDATVLASLAVGTTVDVLAGPVAGPNSTSWYNVGAAGQTGYVPAAALATPPTTADVSPVADASGTDPAASAPASAPVSGSAITTDALNLRAAPDYDAAVLLVVPSGTVVTPTGTAVGDFLPVTHNGTDGWVAVDYLTFDAASEGADVVAPANPTAGTPADSAPSAPSDAPPPSSGFAWPVAGGTWQVIQGYNNGTHTNRSAFAQYHYALDLARVDGETIGQTVYAPVSGTVRWVDRGSGGILIDAGNGYGAALFHVTLDGVASGQQVEQGQPIGTISGPGGDGYMATPHVEIDCWQLSDGGHSSAPFVGPCAIAGREFPDIGGTNQHMGVEITP